MNVDINDFSSLRIVVCDDSIANVMILSKLIESEGVKHVHTFTDPRKVVPFIKEMKGMIDLLVLDIEMPHMTGFDVMRALKTEVPGQHLCPILIITGHQDKDTLHRALLDGANDFIAKPFDQVEVMLRVRNLLRVQLALKAQITLAKQLESDVQQRTEELNKANDLLVYLLALAGEMRDGETGKHVTRVGRYSRILAESIGLPPELCYMIEKAAPLHDVGKIGIPDSILLKQGKLDGPEREIMNSHTMKGLQLLGEFGHDSMLIQMASVIALHHHERWDGGGQPHGVSGESIPIEGRIVAISDVFDALTSKRPYKEPWSIEKTVSFLQENAGTQFDPTLVQVFVDHLDQIVEAMKSLQDDDAHAQHAAHQYPPT